MSAQILPLRILIGLVVAVWLAGPPRAHAQTPEGPSLYDPPHLAAARAFVEATGGPDLTEQVLAVFLPRVGAIMREHYPDITQARLDRFMELFTAAFREQRPIFRQATDRIFADYLSREDLEAGAAFYASSAGRHFIAARPGIAADLRDAGKTGMAIEDVAPHLSPEDRLAYKAFVESDAGRRLAAAQAGIQRSAAEFGARIGRHVSPLAGARALEQMEKEGNGL